MALRSYSQLRIGAGGSYDGEVITWSGVLLGDTMNAMALSHAADRSVQVAGTFDSGSVAIQGSNDGTNYITLTDPQGNALVFTVAGLEAISELTRYLKPLLTGGGATSNLVITVFGGVKR